MPIDDTESFTVSVNNIIINPLKIVTLINGTYTEYNLNEIQTAVTEINTHGGELWLPDTTQTGEITTTHLLLSHNNTQIHGWGMDKTVIHFTDTYGIMASENPGSSESNWRWGLQNLQLDNFMFTGSPLQLVIRKGLHLENLFAQDITKPTAAIRVTCPYGNGSGGYTTSTGHYWPGSIDGMCEDVKIINCHTLRTSSHGYHFHYCVYWGCAMGNPSIPNDILLDGCVSERAGNWSSGTGGWAVGFDLSEAYVSDGPTAEATIQNLTVQNCEAYTAWESGFHFENRIQKLHVHFINCTANGNGRKYVESEPDDPPGEAWTYFYGAGYLHSFKAVASGDSDMTFTNCTANGNGYCGYRNKYSSQQSGNPVYTNCTGDDYPSGNPEGNGLGTYPHKSVGGLCLQFCTGITNTNP